MMVQPVRPSTRGFRRAAACVMAIVSALIAPPLSAQAPDDPHTVQPERPTVATHAGTVAPSWLEVEAGAEHDRFGPAAAQTLTPMVIKLGLASRAQLSLFGSAAHNDETTGIGDLGVGVKLRLLDGAPIVGDFALFPALKFPTGDADRGTGTGTTDGSILLISSHDLGGVALDLNVGYTHRSGDGSSAAKNASLWAVAFGGPFTGPLGWAFETYGYPGTSGPVGQRPIVAVLAGPTWLVRRWLAFDAGVIIPVAGPQPHASYVGGVYNVGRLWHAATSAAQNAHPSY